MAFARAVQDRVEAMKQSRQGVPELPQNLPTALHTFSVLEWEGFAGLDEFYVYLKGCKKACIPAEWKPYFPKVLPENVAAPAP